MAGVEGGRDLISCDSHLPLFRFRPIKKASHDERVKSVNPIRSFSFGIFIVLVKKELPTSNDGIYVVYETSLLHYFLLASRFVEKLRKVVKKVFRATSEEGK